MRKIFIAYSFRAQNAEIYTQVERLIKSHNLIPDNGEALASGPLTAEVQNKIKKCDALVAILTRDRMLEDTQSWIPTDWVKGEFVSAAARGQPCVAVLERDVQFGGPYADYSYILLDRDKPIDALIQLSERLGFWKAEAGRYLPIRLMPADAGELAAVEGKCHYRLGIEGQQLGEWLEGWVDELPGGMIVLNVTGVREQHYVQIEIRQQGVTRWRSPRSSQLVHIELKKLP